MQKLIAKYGLAAHLAFMAVAPLFLFPFVADATRAVVLLWIVLPTTIWLLAEPSVRHGEDLHLARLRVIYEIFHDPLFWVLLGIVIFSGIRALNLGIGLAYDVEVGSWHISDPWMPLLPGSVEAAGLLPFATSCGVLLLAMACRHALGRSARLAFMVISSALAGLAGVAAVFGAFFEIPTALAVIDVDAGCLSCPGLAFGLYLLVGTVALLSVLENEWNLSIGLMILAVGGNVAGLFSFAPLYLQLSVVAAEFLLLLYCLVYARLAIHSAMDLKQLILLGVSLAVGGLLVVAVLPKSVLDARVDSVLNLSVFPERFWERRAVLSVVAFKAWLERLWIGTGLGSFAMDFRFHADAADWELFPAGAKGIFNGWWLVLVERGIVGCATFVVPIGFLLFTYGRRMVCGLKGWRLPHPSSLIGCFVFSLVVGLGFWECSFLRAEVLMAGVAIMSISAASFVRGG